MFLEESLWIKNHLESCNLKGDESIIDIGSSSLSYRNIEQPYIDKNVFEPLRKKGCSIVYLDCKNEKGIDIICNFKDISKLNKQYDIVFCNNVIEHIVKRDKFIEDIIMLVKQHGYLIITAPYDFVYHRDPIDTMFRPLNKELEKVFSNFNVEVIASDLIEAHSAIYHVNRLQAIIDIIRRKVYHVSCLMIRRK